MPEKLIKKLNKTKKGNRTKKALSKTEIKMLLSWLSQDKSVKGLEDYAIVFILITKGGKEAEQELYGPAVETCERYNEQDRMDFI